MTTRVPPEFGTVPIARTPVVGPSVDFPPYPIPWPPPPPPTSDTSSNWSGVITFAAYNDPIKQVTGQWVVPDMAFPPDEQVYQVYVAANWIGIDGWQLPGSPPITDLVQAGTTHVRQFNPGFQGLIADATYLWFEWVPSGPVSITNVPVSPGDVMFCEITVRTPYLAAVHLTNLTTGTSTSFLQKAPAGSRLLGYCAEWILEVPVGTHDNLPYALGRYGASYFDGCLAFSHEKEHTLTGADLVTMIDADDSAISSPTVLGETTFRLDWSAG